MGFIIILVYYNLQPRKIFVRFFKVQMYNIIYYEHVLINFDR